MHPSPKKRKIAAARAAAAHMAAEKTTAAAAAAATPTAASTESNILATKLLDQHRETIKTLRSNISELVNTNTNTTNDDNAELVLSSSLALSNLKSLQRRIALQVEARHAASKERREKVEGCSLVLENLNYERNYLREEIRSMKGWRAAELEKMAWNELGIDLTKLKNEGKEGADRARKAKQKKDDGDIEMEDADTTNKKITTAEGAIDAYLLGIQNNDTATSTASSSTTTASHRDPSNHPHVLRKLQSDLQARSSLVEQLSQSKLHLMELQKKRNDLRGFLNQIPRKIAELEKAGESLNSFFGGGNVWKEVLQDDDDDDTAGGATIGDTVDTTDEGTNDDDAGEARQKKKIRASNLLVHRPSCDRARRFELARSNLPSPLYVLYVQLVGYMDAWASLEKLGGVASSSSSAAASVGSNAAVGGGGGGRKRSKKNAALDGFVVASGMDVSAVSPKEGRGEECNGNDWSVVLTLSPSDILPSETSSILGKTAYSSRSSSASSTAANIKIEFNYSEEQGVVYASVREGKNKGLDDGLLDDFFPGDDGLVNPNVSLSLLTQDEDGENGDSSEEGEKEDVTDMVDADTTANGNIGKPYYWCQVLGGLNFPPPSSSVTIANAESNDDKDDSTASPFQIQTCTKAVFRQLHRRIRARRTLAAILEFLGKRTSHTMHPLPIHPAMKGNEERTSAAAGSVQPQSIKAKLHSWVEDTKESYGKPSTTSSSSSYGPPSAKRYVATIKRKSNTLKATVIVDARAYPAEKPPVWSLQNEDGSSGGLSSWGEDHGSVSSLQQQNSNGNNGSGGAAPPLFDANLHRIECHVNQNLDKFVNGNVENTYDWILMHQLADVVSCWDEVMSAGEAAGGSGNGGGGGRLRKGRDRRLMGFGERSPFFWYRNGL